MKRILLCFNVLLTILLVSCGGEKGHGSGENYEVRFNSNSIYVKMRCPTSGIIEIGSISFDGFEPEDIEKEIFEGIRDRGYSGDYIVYVTLQFKDEYGNCYDSPETVEICTLNSKEVKRYASYGDFRSKIPFSKAYPWNYDYNK